MSLIKTNLKYFDQAVRDGSIRKAADNLHIASSAVNRQLLQLEQDLDVKLFERLPRGISPTAAGEALLGHVRRWKQDEARLHQEIGRLKGGIHGTIRIAAAESITKGILPRAMGALNKQYPYITFSVVSGDNYEIKSAVLSKNADIVCAFDMPEGGRTNTAYTFPAKIGAIMAAGHPLSQKKAITPDACTPYPLITPTNDWLAHSVLRELIEDKRTKFRIGATVDRVSMIKSLVMAGIGIAFMSSVGFEREIEDGSLDWVPFVKDVIDPTIVSLILPDDRPQPIYTKVFIDCLKHELAQIRAD